MIQPGCAAKPEVAEARTKHPPTIDTPLTDCADAARAQDDAPSFVRLSLNAVAKLRLYENGSTEALVAAHAREKAALHEQNAALAALVSEKLGADALAAATGATEEAVRAGRESDAGAYCAMLLAGQAQARKMREDAAATTAAAEAARAEAESRVAAAEAAQRDVEARCAEPLRAFDAAAEAEARAATALADARFLRAKLDQERQQRERLQLILDGDAHTLRKLPAVQLEALLTQLSRARDAATAVLVDVLVEERRAAEAEAVAAEARRRAEAEKAEALECTICCAAPMDTALDCGHRSCSTCAAKLLTCHLCRGQVKSRLKLY